MTQETIFIINSVIAALSPLLGILAYYYGFKDGEWLGFKKGTLHGLRTRLEE